LRVDRCPLIAQALEPSVAEGRVVKRRSLLDAAFAAASSSLAAARAEDGE
jgi:hypothetical protein